MPPAMKDCRSMSETAGLPSQQSAPIAPRAMRRIIARFEHARMVDAGVAV
jgi:hypothetical protein